MKSIVVFLSFLNQTHFPLSSKKLHKVRL